MADYADRRITGRDRGSQWIPFGAVDLRQPEHGHVKLCWREEHSTEPLQNTPAFRSRQRFESNYELRQRKRSFVVGGRSRGITCASVTRTVRSPNFVQMALPLDDEAGSHAGTGALPDPRYTRAAIQSATEARKRIEAICSEHLPVEVAGSARDRLDVTSG